MSINSVPDIVRQGWRLEEDLDRIIRIERLRDVSQKFSNQIKPVVDAFRARSRMRVIAFNEQSGIDRDSKAIFEAFISGEREVFYIGPLSNRECCVILVYDSTGESKLRSYKHTLPHEYAHHVQFAHESFPFLIAREVDEEKWSRAKISSGCSVV
jgi:hypothetical protein